MTGKRKDVIEPHCHFNFLATIIRSFGFGYTALEEVTLNKFCMCLVTAVAAFTLYGTAYAMTPGQHPGYLHALTELKTARWMINHRATNAPASVAADGAVRPHPRGTLAPDRGMPQARTLPKWRKFRLNRGITVRRAALLQEPRN
jgi:hypothetical protein